MAENVITEIAANLPSLPMTEATDAVSCQPAFDQIKHLLEKGSALPRPNRNQPAVGFSLPDSAKSSSRAHSEEDQRALEEAARITPALGELKALADKYSAPPEWYNED